MRTTKVAALVAALLAVPTMATLNPASAGGGAERDAQVNPDTVVAGEPATATPLTQSDGCFGPEVQGVGAAGDGDTLTLEWQVSRTDPDAEQGIDSGLGVVEQDGMWTANLNTDN